MKIVKKVILVVAILVFVFSAYKLASYFLDSYSNQKDIANLTNGEEKGEYYARLKSQNDDFVAWIEIKNTKVNYPVMWTPSEPEKYIRKNFNKEYAVCGLPFIDANCDVEKPTSNFIIYGHHMKDGTMFGSIMKYKKESYFKKHKIINFDIINEDGSYEEGEYEVLGAFYAEILTSESKKFKYYKAFDIDSTSSYNNYVANVKKKALYDTDVDAQYGQHLITLSTCSYHTDDDNGRFVVVAVKTDSKGAKK